MDYDECLVELGEFGPWQITTTLILWIPMVIDGILLLTRYLTILIVTKNPIFLLSSSYTTLAPDSYRCNIPGCDDVQNFEFSDFPRNLLFPSLANLNGSHPPDNPDYCDYFKPEINAIYGSCLQVTLDFYIIF